MASRKERTQKRHKSIRGKVRCSICPACARGTPGDPACGQEISSFGTALQVEGRPERPRLAVYRSNNHIYAQVRPPLMPRCCITQTCGNDARSPRLSKADELPLFAQVIDDIAQNTLVAASTLTPEIRAKLNGGGGANKVVHQTDLPNVPRFAGALPRMFHLSVHKQDRQLSHAMCVPRRQDAAQLVGQRIAELCLAKDIGQVSFDRGGNIYHGRVKVQHRAFALSSAALPGCVFWQWNRPTSADWGLRNAGAG